MAIICCICGRKQSGWLVDYPLSKELSNERICAECYEKYRKILDAKNANDVIEEITYLKEQMKRGVKDKAVVEYLALLFDRETGSVDEVDKKMVNQRNKRIASVMVTSGYNFEGHKITKYCDYISTQVVLGIGAIKAFVASVTNFVGEESETLNNKIEEAKSKAIEELKMKAIAQEANAIIGIDIDFTMFADTMLAVIASGTAVVIENS